MKYKVQTKGLPCVKTGKIVLWPAIHAYCDQGPDYCKVCHYRRGLAFYFRAHPKFDTRLDLFSNFADNRYFFHLSVHRIHEPDYRKHQAGITKIT